VVVSSCLELNEYLRHPYNSAIFPSALFVRLGTCTKGKRRGKTWFERQCTAGCTGTNRLNPILRLFEPWGKLSALRTAMLRGVVVKASDPSTARTRVVERSTPSPAPVIRNTEVPVRARLPIGQDGCMWHRWVNHTSTRTLTS